jgi:transposase
LNATITFQSEALKDKYIGFDIDDKKTVACVIEKGKKERYQKLDTDIKAMRTYLKQQKTTDCRIHLTFEVSGQAGYLYDSLQGYADTITVNNPSQMTWIYRTSKKNDRIDARKQALVLSIGEIPKVHMPSKRIRQWRNSIQHRRRLIGRIVQIKNRIRSLIKARGYKKPIHSGSWWKPENRRWMQGLSTGRITSLQLWRMQLADLLDELALLEQQRKRMTDYLDGFLSQNPAATLLMTIPGVGPRTAEAVLAYTDDIKRFGRTKQYCAYFGVTPKLDESGTTRRLGHISKQGPSVVRWLVAESAWQIIRKSPSMKAFYERVMAGQPSRKKIAVVAVMRKLFGIMRAMLMTGELYNEDLVCRECHEKEPEILKQTA